MIAHILNGDALREQFPDLPGQVHVAREALVDGPVAGATPEAVYRTRAQWMAAQYPEVTLPMYQKKSVAEFEAMRQLPDGAEIYLWFERDLFCQVNLWFVLSLLQETGRNYRLALVLPTASLQWGFGGMSQEELEGAFRENDPLTGRDIELWSQFWPAYQDRDRSQLRALATALEARWPFVSAAVAAELARWPEDGRPGRPQQSLMDIRTELGTDQFGPVFQEFCRREAIYGFGDLQVKRMWDGLLTNDSP